MIFETSESPFHILEKLEFSEKAWLQHWYPLICAFLEIIPEEDETALRNIISKCKSNINIEELQEILFEKEAYVFAPGPSLEEQFHSLDLSSNSDNVLISADGATSFLLAQNIIPDIVVSDLDGQVNEQIIAQKQGSILLVHIHSHNILTVEEVISQLCKGRLVITTQLNPINGSYNFLGFTDGDRGVCLSAWGKAVKTVLVGFDFGDKIGRYSKVKKLTGQQKDRKLKKFVIAKSVINWCTHNGCKINYL